MAEEIARIIERSPQPYKTVWRLVAETGIRRGEICGLNVSDFNVNHRIIVVQGHGHCVANSRLPRPESGMGK